MQPTLLRQLLCLHEIRFRYADRIVRVGDLEWRLRDTGGGPSVLIMLPGSLGNADIFHLQQLHLVSRARCIAIDYPESPTAALADGLPALIDVLNIGRVNLLGCSLAGYWLQTFGSRHPGRIKSLTLANAFRGSGDLRRHQQPQLQSLVGDVARPRLRFGHQPHSSAEIGHSDRRTIPDERRLWASRYARKFKYARNFKWLTLRPFRQKPCKKRRRSAKLQAVGCHSLKAEWLARLEAREPDHLRDAQIEVLRYGQTGESLRGPLLAAATAPLAPLMPLASSKTCWRANWPDNETP